MRFMSDAETGRSSKGVWRHGKKHGPAVCPVCRQRIVNGSWVKKAPGRGFVVRHAYACPTVVGT